MRPEQRRASPSLPGSGQFFLGKSYPGFGPIGPFAVTADEFPDRYDIGFECRLSDEIWSTSATSDRPSPPYVLRLLGPGAGVA
jgi:2-keto-4-pentenoate hydratase/2-oxohepta-3-ene-1,7-dioic acid hydratase in catechol pathway